MNRLTFFAFQALFALLGVALIYFLKIPTSLLNFTMSEEIITKTCLYFLPLGALAVFFTSSLALKVEFLREIFERIMVSPFGQFVSTGKIWAFFVVSILAGVGEELLFRGALQNKIGVILAALAFGLCHFVSWGFFVLATTIGIYLGNVYILTSHNLVPPMAIHTLYDFLVLILMQRLVRRTNWTAPV